jgi:hypothetical protein
LENIKKVVFYGDYKNVSVGRLSTECNSGSEIPPEYDTNIKCILVQIYAEHIKAEIAIRENRLKSRRTK